MKQKGFTLAEMLIALALIGVIAALLIPKLLSSVGNRQDVAKVRSVVSTVERALNTGMMDPDANRNQTFAQFMATQVPQGTAPTTLQLDCGGAAAVATAVPAPTAAIQNFFFPDGSGLFITGATNNMNADLTTTTTNAAAVTAGATANICIELNTRTGATDGYSGLLTVQNFGTASRYVFNWNAAAAGGASQNAAQLLF